MPERDDAEARIRALSETIDASLGESMLSDMTMRIGVTVVARSDLPPDLPLFDSVKEAGNLRLGETLGEGGMGLVRKARQEALHRDVAVKTVQPQRESRESNHGLFHEALVTGVLEHPNIVPIYSLYRDEHGAPLIVMKRVEGRAWSECITQPAMIPEEGRDDPLGWHLEVFDEVCRAAHFAHSGGIIHRDIKPDNVMIGSHGEVYLLDWGVAVTFDDEKSDYLLHVADAEGIAGTPVYMAPEMVTAERGVVSVASDVYLLGATLYHALSGSPPHNGNTLFAILIAAHTSQPAPLPAHIPEELERICRKAMSVAPADRFDSAEELRRAVHDFRDHRASIHLSDAAEGHLREFREHVERRDLGLARKAFERCRSGCEHAVSVWADNADAIALFDEAHAAMATLELGERNLASAEALLAAMSRAPEELRTQVAALRESLAEEEEEVEELREIERQTSVETGATSRMVAATIAWVLLTIMPLVASVGTDVFATDLAPFFAHGIFVCVALFGLVFAFRTGLWSNTANQRIAGVIAAFAISLPLLRYVAWQSNMNIISALSVEAASYTVGYAALGLLSSFSPWFGVGCYAIAAVVGVHFPEQIFVATSISNFFAIGWVVLAYRRQR